MCLPLRQDASRRFGVAGRCLHVLALWTIFSACSSLMTSRQIGLSTLRRIFTVRCSGPQLCFTQELWTWNWECLKMGDIPRTSQNGNVYWQHDEAIWDAPYFDQLCFQELHCPFCSCLEGSKKSCGQSLSIGSFPFLAAGLCYCAGIPLQANLLTENWKKMHHFKSWMWYFAWGYRMASLFRVATIYSVFLAARGRPRLRLWCCENLTCCVTAMHSRRKLWSRLLGDHRRIGTARSCRTLDLSMPCCNALLRNVLGKLATDGNCSTWPPEPPELVLRWQPALKFGARKWTWNCSRQRCL